MEGGQGRGVERGGREDSLPPALSLVTSSPPLPPPTPILDVQGIPTTRAACIVTSDTRVTRDPLYDGTVIQVGWRSQHASCWTGQQSPKTECACMQAGSRLLPVLPPKDSHWRH